MNGKLIFLALFFFFNPDVDLFDLLPDFIGCLILLRVLTPFVPLSSDAESGCRSLRYLSGISLAKTLLFLPALSLNSSDPGLPLLLTSSFAILELVFLIPALNALFKTVLLPTANTPLTLPGFRAAQIAAFLFLILRRLLTVLPNTIYLVLDEFFLFGTVYPLAPYKGVLAIFSALLSLCLGLLYLVFIGRFFLRLKKNRPYPKAVAEILSTIPPDPIGQTLAAISGVTLFLTLSGFCAIGFNVDGRPVIPLCLFPVCLLLAERKAERFLAFPKKKKWGLILSLTVSALSYLTIFLFCDALHVSSDIRLTDLKGPFLLPLSTEILSNLLFLLPLFRLYKLLVFTVENHTGNYWETAFYNHNAAVAKERKGLLFRAKAVLFLGVAVALLNASSYATLYLFPHFRLVSALLVLLWALLLSSVCSTIRRSAKEKYGEMRPEKTGTE